MSTTSTISFAGTADNTSAKQSFSILPYTTNGPSTPHQTSFDSRAVAANTSLVLPGKGVVDYSELVLGGLVYVLENFAASIPPTFPTIGQVWYNTTDKTLNVCTGSVDGIHGTWALAQTAYTASQPQHPVAGSLWYNPTDQKYRTWNGSAWVLTLTELSQYLPLSGGTITGPLSLSVTPTLPAHVTTKQYVDNELNQKLTIGSTIPMTDVTGLTAALATYVPLSGGTMSGDLVLSAAPTQPLQAATKQYVDDALAGKIDVGGTIPISAVVNLQSTLNDKVSKTANDTITGRLSVPTPINATHIANKAYVDSLVGGVSSLAGLTDTSIVSPIDGDILAYSGTLGKWESGQPNTMGVTPISHITQSSGAHNASSIAISSAGMTATNVSAAVTELNNTKLNSTNGTLGGDINANGHTINNIAYPLQDLQATNKQYVDARAAHNQIVAALTASTSMRTFPFYANQHSVSVFKDGIKQYADSATLHVIDFDNAITSLTQSTGLADDIAGYQTISFSPSITYVDATDLIPSTVYTATITVDDGIYPISVTGSAVSTFSSLVATLSTILNGIATVSLVSGSIRVTSATKGATSNVSISAGTLFAAPLNNFQSIVTGPENVGSSTLYTGSITTSTSHQIVGASTTTDSITIPGNYWNWISPGQTFTIVGSTGNNGTYTVDATGGQYSFVNGTTTFFTTTAIPSNTADGQLRISAHTRNLIVRGGQATTFAKLADAIQNGISELVVESDSGTSTFKIANNFTALFVPGFKFWVKFSATSGSIFTTASSSYSTGYTTITVVEPVTTSTVRSDIIIANATSELSVRVGGDIFLQSTTPGSFSTIVVANSGTNPLWSTLANYVSVGTSTPGITGAYYEDLSPSVSYVNTEKKIVTSSIKFNAPITGNVEVITTGEPL